CAQHEQVDVVEACPNTLVGLARTHLCVEVERLAEADVDGAEAAADRSRDWPLERDAGAPHRVERRLGQRVAAELVHHVGAGLLDVPGELDAGGLDNTSSRLPQPGTGAL